MLRIGTHNVAGLFRGGWRHLLREGDAAAPPTAAELPTHYSQRLLAHARLWARQRLDVVCLQETHVPAAEVPLAMHALASLGPLLHGAGWEAWFSPADQRCRAGVAVLVRSSLLRSHLLEVRAPQLADDGRMVTCQLRWGGHCIHLVAAYLPSADPAGQQQFIAGRLAQLPASGLRVWAADWNFVEEPARDATGQRRDAPTAALLHQLCPGMKDAYRRLYPQGRAFTYMQLAARQPAAADQQQQQPQQPAAQQQQ